MESKKIQKNELKNHKNKLCDYFKILSEIIDLEDHWTIEKSIEIEIKKSFIRGMIRYSPISYEITQELKKFIIKKLDVEEKFKWITLPYPMIHLVDDFVEAEGGFHYDFDKGDGKNLITLWMQLTDYKYDSLTFVKNSSFLNIFSKYFIKFNFLNYFSKKSSDIKR